MAMQFTDAVSVAGNPPVAPDLLIACKRALGRFVVENGIATPAPIEWTEEGEAIRFTGHHNGRFFGIAARINDHWLPV